MADPSPEPPTQPQSQPLQEVAFTTQMRHLSIALDEKRHLVVRTRLTPAPNAMLGIVLDPNVESSAQRSLRERLVRCLSRISMEGGAAAAALPHPVYYRCGPDQEQQLFDHITQRICAILGLSLHTLAGPAQRGKRRPDSHTAGSSGGAAAGDGAKKAKKCTLKTYVLRVKMDLAPLLETHITAESMRIKASASVCKKNTEESAASKVVLQLEGTSSQDAAPWFLGREAKRGVEAAVERGFGETIVRLRGAFRTDPGEVLAKLPLVIGDAQGTSLSGISLHIHRLLSPLLGGTIENCASGWGSLPDLAISRALSFLGNPQRVATAVLIDKRWARLAAESVRRVGLVGVNAAGRAGGGTTLLARVRSLEELTLVDGEAMGEAARALKRGWHWSCLRSLRLLAWAAEFRNRPQKGHVNAIASAVTQHGLPSLESLSVCLADQRSTSAAIVSAMLASMLGSGVMPHLTELQVRGRHGLTASDVEALAKMLDKRSLHVLRLDLSTLGHTPMPVDVLLGSCPGLTSLSLAWQSGIEQRDDPMRLGVSSRLCSEGVRLLADTLPAMSGLQTLELRVDVGLSVSALPVLERLKTGLGYPRLQLLHLEGFEAERAMAEEDPYGPKHVAAAWRALVAAGRLRHVKELRVMRGGLHLAHVLSILREAKVGPGMSLLPQLQRLDLSGNPLLTEEEAAAVAAEEGGLVALPVGLALMPLAVIRAVVLGKLRNALHPVVLEV